MAALLEGRGHEYIPFARQSVGLIHDTEPRREDHQDIVEETDRVLAGLAPRLREAERST